MRRNVMGPLQAEMLSDVCWPAWKQDHQDGFVLSLETHYPISMIQYINKTTGPVASEEKLALFCKNRNSGVDAEQIKNTTDLNYAYVASLSPEI